MEPLGARAQGEDLAKRVEDYFDRLWPICRSITGPGYRASLDILSEIMPVERLIFETGAKAFDWTVPKEWTPRCAHFIDPHGKKHADFMENNLHLLGYSVPFHGKMSFSDLRPHLHSLPELPEAIPYLTSYYQERWGFCLSHNELKTLSQEGEYEVFIDTELKNGHLVIGELVLPGETDDEVMFSACLCHPSLANNELSGPLVMAFLYERIAAMRNRAFTYRFVIVPETIGAIVFLSQRGQILKERLKAGFVLTCLGDNGSFNYKLSRQGHSLGDRAARVVLRDIGKHEIVPFSPFGSDERQYCSPGFNLPVGSLMRTMYNCYPQYHTSLDNKEFISFASMVKSIEAYEAIIHALERNAVWKGTVLRGEPHLGERGLYPTLGSQRQRPEKLSAMMWLLNLADGSRDLIDIAEQSGKPINVLISVADELSRVGLLKRE